MWRVLKGVATGVRMAYFALACLFGAPIILLDLGVSAVRERIETRWPKSRRARAISFWIGFLTPFIVLLLLAIALAVVLIQNRHRTHA